MAATTEIRRVINADMRQRSRSMHNHRLRPEDLNALAEIAAYDIALALIGSGIKPHLAIEMVYSATRYANSPDQASCDIRNGLPPSLF